ncbi:MAG TPA: FAD-dependent oxidoreductase, partial [Chthonomonadales bacterium]|nr:FAD-dependent oxidoreductase [Chthonomonadales bacterium]
MKTRREFLQQATAVGIAPFASFSPMERHNRPQSVIIIGAGLAGLVAAYELMRVGHTVILLEARLRPGGRVHTLREPFSDGLYAEAGALFIPDHHELTLRYVRLFNLTLDRIPERGAARWYYLRGKRFRTRLSRNLPLDLTLEEQRMGPAGLWRHYIDSVLPEIGDPTLPGWPPKSLQKYDDMSFAEFLRTRGASADAVALLRVSYLDLWGDGIEAISALGLLRDLALRRGERRTYAIRGGNDLLPQAFAERMKEQIHYGAVVTRVEQNADGVRVFYRQADKQRVITADRAICAIPFSC